MEIKISLPILATVLLSALKVSGVITWSWLWVLSPLWIPLVIAILITIALYIILKGDTEKMDKITEALKELSEKNKK